MITHQQAATFTAEGFIKRFKRAPTRAERQVLQGVAWLETRYGGGWKGEGRNSYNMGAIQAHRPPCDGKTSFEYTDTTPTSGGGSIPYRICFRKYSSPSEGFSDLAKVVYQNRPSVLEAAGEGDLYKVSKLMRETLYYEGFGKTQEERIANHHRALKGSVILIARSLEEPMPDGSPMPPRVLRLGVEGADVKRLQRALVIPQTGKYDAYTKETVEMFQSGRRGVTVDGIVGHDETWPLIFAIEDSIGDYDHEEGEEPSTK